MSERGHLSSVLELIRERLQYGQHFRSGHAEAVQRGRSDQTLDHFSIYVIFANSAHEIAIRFKFTVLFALSNQALNSCLTDVLYGAQSKANAAVFCREAGEALVNVGGQNLNIHIFCSPDILRCLLQAAQITVEHGCHEFNRVIVFEPGCVVGDNSVRSAMSFIKGVSREGHDIFENFLCDIQGNSVGTGSGNNLACLVSAAAQEKVFVAGDNFRFLLRHSAAHIIRLTIREAGQIAHNPHDLFLVHCAAISDIENRL